MSEKKKTAKQELAELISRMTEEEAEAYLSRLVGGST